MLLNGIWKLAGFEPGAGEREGAASADLDDRAWLDAPVPGNVHSALVQAGRLPPPFYHLNLEACRWVEDREWWYRRSFEYADGAPAAGWQVLVCDGLDTVCSLYLNGELLGRHENMFVEARFDVTGRLRRGRNVIALRFDPVLAYVGQRQVPGQWTRRAPARAMVRKAQHQFGWDWSPAVLTVGPWRGVRLETYQVARLAGVHFWTRLLTADQHWAEAAVEVEIESGPTALPPGLEVAVGLTRGQQRQTLVTEAYGDGRASAALGVSQPDLWWTHDLGVPALYDLDVQLRWEGRLLDTYRSQVGLRTVTWDQAPDPEEPGTHFFAPVLNGVRVFAKGANWVPADSFLSEVDEARYREWIELATAAQMNMLRVWGGGVYEDEAFYRLCDEHGVLVWQDFMYACALYPSGDAAFCANAEREARLAVRRLRNHPCLALWCGNNENDWLDDQRAWAEPGRDFPGKALYHQVFPRVVAELDPGTAYWPSSPYGGNDHNDAAAGDRHNWQVWHGSVYPRRFGQRPETSFTPEGVSYRHYAEDAGRFISEFGIHAWPVLETLRRNLPADQLHPDSEGLLYRNKDNPKDKGRRLMLAHTGQATSLEQTIDFSMITQAEGLKFGIEHYRSRKPHCSGTLVWQLNDCWPGISWSLLDYYRRPKAGYFFVKRAFAPVLAAYQATPAGVELWLVNDRPEVFADELVWGRAQFTGGTLFEEHLAVDIPPNSARLVGRSRDQQAWPSSATDYFYVHSSSGAFPSNRLFLAEVKDLQRPLPAFETEAKQVSAHEIELRFHSDRFVYFVKIGCAQEGTRYTDNYFDLFPGREVVIRLWNAFGRPLSLDQVLISSLPAPTAPRLAESHREMPARGAEKARP